MVSAKEKAAIKKCAELASEYSRASQDYLTHLSVMAGEGDKRAAQALAEASRGPIIALFSLVNRGNESAAEALVNLISRNVESLTNIPNKKALVSIAGKRTHWPALIFARGKDNGEWVNAIAAQIGLGIESGLKLSGKTADLRTTETGIVFGIWQEIEDDRQYNRVKLSPLSRNPKNLNEWWEKIEARFLEIYGNDFQLRKEFAHHRGEHARRDIRKALKQALRSLAVG